VHFDSGQLQQQLVVEDHAAAACTASNARNRSEFKQSKPMQRLLFQLAPATAVPAVAACFVAAGARPPQYVLHASLQCHNIHI
jgi:hypothetical protein